MIELGDRVRDKPSGIEGIVVTRTELLYTHNLIGIQPPDDIARTPRELPQYEIHEVEERRCEKVG